MRTKTFVSAYLNELDPAASRDAPHCRADVMFGASGTLLALAKLQELGFESASKVPVWMEETQTRLKDDLTAYAPEDLGGAIQAGYASGSLGPLFALAYAAIGGEAESSATDRVKSFVSAATLLVESRGLIELFGGTAGIAILANQLARRLDARPGYAAARASLLTLGALARSSLLEFLRTPQPAGHLLGWAHGASGLLYSVLVTEGEVPSFVEERLQEFRALAMRDGRLIAWPTHQGDDEPTPLWFTICNGVAGQLVLWSAAYARTSDASHLAVADDCAHTTAALLVNEPSLCCGAAGQAAALFAHVRAGGSERYRRVARSRLDRAMCFGATERGLYKGRDGIAVCAAQFATKNPVTFPYLL